MNKPHSNQINPKKLLTSKWTSLNPKQKQRHFIVVDTIKDESEVIIACQLEAVINKQCYEMDWKCLKNSDNWLMGWK